MQAKLQQLGEACESLTDLPGRLSDHVDELKASPKVQKLQELDAKAGRWFSRLTAVLWSAAAIPVLGAGYLAWTFTGGWFQTGLLGLSGVLLAWIVWSAVSRILNPPSASELIIDEVEDRVRPAAWALRAIRFVTGR